MDSRWITSRLTAISAPPHSRDLGHRDRQTPLLATLWKAVPSSPLRRLQNSIQCESLRLSPYALQSAPDIPQKPPRAFLIWYSVHRGAEAADPDPAKG